MQNNFNNFLNNGKKKHFDDTIIGVLNFAIIVL